MFSGSPSKPRLLPRIQRRRTGPRQGGVKGARLLLIGTPGTGKRPVGHYLAEHRGYVHLDFEDEATRTGLLTRTDDDLKDQFAVLAADGRGVVITWAAGPVAQLRDVGRLRSFGLEPIWFDSDRGAAFRAHYADLTRADLTRADLTRADIALADAAAASGFRFVDSFDTDGRFRPVEDVVEELVTPRLRPRPTPVRSACRAARNSLTAARPSPVRAVAGSLGARIAGGLALAAGTAAATVALLSGVGNPTPGARPAQVRAALAAPVVRAAALPQRGVLVAGHSLAGIELGDSMATVRALWGGHFTRCGECKPALWLYIYPPPADPVGAGVQFSHGKVVAVFTLGGPLGWHSSSGIRVGQILDNPTPASPDRSTWLSCAGYSAEATRTGTDAVTSILTQGAAVYGFALTRPSVSPCK